MNMPNEAAVMVGLEIHVELKTNSKLFCGCASRFGAAPNSLSCPICAGHPGALPRPNRTAVLQGLRLGLALGGDAADVLLFDRKNYFYPDLPKGYQITQRRKPLITGGALAISTPEGFKTIDIIEAHIEEDAGKLRHDRARGLSFADLNRSGVPLLEVVTAPCLSSGEEAAQFARRLRDLAVWLGVSDGRMEEGSLRADVNVSLWADGWKGERTEIKNLSSFRDIVHAVDAEAQRQKEIYSAGGSVQRRTLRWDADSQTISVLREKEGADAYRYQPERDIPPVSLPQAMRDDMLRGLGCLPHQLELELIALGVDEEKADLICRDRAQAMLCQAVIARGAPAREAANWILGDCAAIMRRRGLAEYPVSLSHTVARIIALVEERSITRTVAKQLLEELFDGGDVDETVAARGLKQLDDLSAVREAVAAVIAEGGKALGDYRSGKQKAFAAIMGAVMRRLGGRVAPQTVTRVLREELDG